MLDLFRRLLPARWQHDNPRVRAQAAEQLDPGHTEQRQRLLQLAQDPSSRVRTAALDQLEDPATLLHLYGGGSPPATELTQRLVAVLAGRSGNATLATRLALVERIDDPELLAALCLQGDNQQLRLAALSRLTQEEALIRQACDNSIAAVRHAAAARVESDAGLARLAQEAHRDRQVMRQARERLNQRRTNAAELAAARHKRVALLDDLERHAHAPWEPLYAGRLRHLMREWSALEVLPDAEQERRYQEACLRCRKVIGDHEAQQRASAVADAHRERADREREALVESLEEGLDALNRSNTISAQDVASLRAHKQLLAQRWQRVSDRHLANATLRQRYDAARERLEQLSRRLERQADAASSGAPDASEPDARERQANLAKREALCEQLETLLAQPATNADPDALREIRDRARDQWRRASPIPKAHAQRAGRRFARLRHALQALIDSRANEIASDKRDLIEQMRALLTQSAPAAQRAEQAKALQREWRTLGRAPKGEEQALWQEFRHLCDQVFAAREAERHDSARQTRERLAAMQALIDRMDAWQPTSSDEAATLEAAVAEAATLEPLPAGRRTEGMRRRWSGIMRARRERLERLAVIERIRDWHAVRPLLQAHLAADAERLDGGEARQVALPAVLSAPSAPSAAHDAMDEAMNEAMRDALRRAHRRRNAARLSPPPAEEVAERLARLRVHLSLLAVGSVSHHDDPLRLAIQVERLNERCCRERSRAENVQHILSELLALGPVPAALWAQEASELERLLERLTRLPPP